MRRPCLTYLEREGLDARPRSSPRTITATTSAASRRCSRAIRVPVFGPARETIPRRTQRAGDGDRIDVPGIDVDASTCSTCRATPPATSPTSARRATRRRSSAATRCSPAAAGACSRARRRRCGRRLSALAALPADDARLLRPRVHAGQSPLRARGRARQCARCSADRHATRRRSASAASRRCRRRSARSARPIRSCARTCRKS